MMKRQILEHEADEITTKNPRYDEDDTVEKKKELLILPQQKFMRKHDDDKTNSDRRSKQNISYYWRARGSKRFYSMAL